MQRLVDRLEGHVADAVAYPDGDTLHVQVVTAADGLKKRDADRRHPQAGAAQLLGGGRRLGRGHGANLLLLRR
jgi:hypothetical protein